MKKLLISLSIIILTVSIILIVYLNIKVSLNKRKNDKFLEIYNQVFVDNDFNYSDDLSFPVLEMNGNNYIGVINTLKDNLLIPIESSCNNLFTSIKSMCKYYDENFTIMGTNLKDSFNFYKKYDVNDKIIFINNLGSAFEYRIKAIKRISKLNNIKNYNEDLIIVIKDYYSLEYILFICELD